MQKRSLGKSHLEIVPLVLGGNVFGWTADDATSFRILDAFVDAGFDAVDTANMYSAWVPGHKGGESETVIGKWFAQGGKREKVKLFTKVGNPMGDGSKGLKKEYILQQVEDSLKRLQTDHIDLYQSHMDDDTTPLDETLEAYQILIGQGKVGAIGASNYGGARLAEALEVSNAKNLPAYISLQPEYNLYDRAKYESDLAPVLSKYGIGSIVYWPLASGFLTGKYKTKADAAGAKREGMVGKYFDDRGLKILKALAEVSEETGAAQATVTLAWTLAQPTVTAPIASVSKPEQLDALLASVSLKLSEEQVKKLTDASAY
ncbi:aldo/keto reductase [Granulicella cerasi]|uniref:Aldo/keto reductase n=1 Tax=Granulicella cerasi TaxID=741063 RepID=A0ABW1Z9X1_9BACT|nr:aldo/keto reductase [Granulicella cerasi]